MEEEIIDMAKKKKPKGWVVAKECGWGRGKKEK